MARPGLPNPAMEVVMLKLHRTIKTTTDKVPGELDTVEFLGGLVLSVAYSGGRDWIIVVRGDSTWAVEGEDLDRDDVRVWMAEHVQDDAGICRLTQLDDGTVRVDVVGSNSWRVDPKRRLPFPTGHIPAVTAWDPWPTTVRYQSTCEKCLELATR